MASRQKLVPDREGFGDHGGEAGVDFSLGAILDDEALLLASASRLQTPLSTARAVQRHANAQGSFYCPTLAKGARALGSMRKFTRPCGNSSV